MDDGLKFLSDFYEGGSWVEEGILEERFSLAKGKGYLLDYPEYETHSDTLKRIRAILAQIDPKDIANAFLFSLSTRKLEYRSALGSYYYAAAIHEHELMNSENEMLAAGSNHCYLCGWSACRYYRVLIV